VRTVHPADADEAARCLSDAARAGERIRIEGSGTKRDWNRAVPDADVVLGTRGLNREITHRHGDLTATIEAGVALSDANRALGAHRQWIPLDPPWSDRATVGGIVATNDAGPRRHRFGAPRDLIIGIEIARVDGARARAGGIVVKNVAGYDLARMLTGSFGSLGLILNATFKLYPLASASRTAIAELPTHAAAATLVKTLNASQLTPTAVELETGPLRILVRFESTERAAEHQAGAAIELMRQTADRAEVVAGPVERQIWESHAARPWAGEGVVLKVTCLPSRVPFVLDSLAGSADPSRWEAVGRCGLGVLLVRLDVDTMTAAQLIARLRLAFGAGEGTVAIRRAPADLDALVASTPFGDAADVMQAVKRAFDPAGVLPPFV
jgi:glycolate dehydrogenase FAD-binding subunit